MPPRPLPAGPGQESVWSYPRPPRLEPTARHVQIVHRGVVVADTRRALRLLETSHPPTYYLPPEDVRLELLRPADGSSFCEWKGVARYVSVVIDGAEVPRCGWTYPEPVEAYAALRDHLAFYAGLLDACTVDGQLVVPQPGGFYGGWITPELVGPFKGEPGSRGW